MVLEDYRKKRDFSRTPEPPGDPRPAGGFSYCIQKHAASRLHYDFRLELDGVLLSWAVPKGPSFDPRDKRLAMHVEDHPVEYGSFEGVIPSGDYGAGTVVLWDRGTWTPIIEPSRALEKGELKFLLHGEKLVGKWALVRIKGDDPKAWLLVKDKDESDRLHGCGGAASRPGAGIGPSRRPVGAVPEREAAGVGLAHPRPGGVTRIP